MSNAAVAIKLETIRQINKKLQDPQQASAASTIASIAYLATAVRVSTSLGFYHITSDHH